MDWGGASRREDRAFRVGHCMRGAGAGALCMAPLTARAHLILCLAEIIVTPLLTHAWRWRWRQRGGFGRGGRRGRRVGVAGNVGAVPCGAEVVATRIDAAPGGTLGRRGRRRRLHWPRGRQQWRRGRRVGVAGNVGAVPCRAEVVATRIDAAPIWALGRRGRRWRQRRRQYRRRRRPAGNMGAVLRRAERVPTSIDAAPIWALGRWDNGRRGQRRGQLWRRGRRVGAAACSITAG